MGEKTGSKDMMRIRMGFLASALVVLGVIAYGIAAATYGIFDITEILLVGTALTLAVSAAFVIRDRMKSVKRGLPAEDEMSKRGIEKAGYYSYLASVYIALGIGFFSDDLQITVSQATGAIILFSAIIFIGLAIYYRKRGV